MHCRLPNHCTLPIHWTGGEESVITTFFSLATVSQSVHPLPLSVVVNMLIEMENNYLQSAKHPRDEGEEKIAHLLNVGGNWAVCDRLAKS